MFCSVLFSCWIISDFIVDPNKFQTGRPKKKRILGENSKSTTETFINAASKKLSIISSVFFQIVIVYEFFSQEEYFALCVIMHPGMHKKLQGKEQQSGALLSYSHELFHILHQTFQFRCCGSCAATPSQEVGQAVGN